MKHKHAEIIKAFADGIECEGWLQYSEKWFSITILKDFDSYETVRIKPEPKPDVIDYAYVDKNPMNHSMTKIEWTVQKWANLKLTFDGETGKLKSAEVV
jgi:hypothetical protein